MANIPDVTTTTEGTWPVTFGDGTINFTLSQNSAFFVRVGNMVQIQFHLRVTAKNGATPGSFVQISLPFPMANGRGSIAIGDADFINFGTDRIGARLAGSDAMFFRLHRNPPLLARVQLTVADMDDGVVPGNGNTRVAGGGTYQTFA